jgi:hypothetical protein
MLSLDWINLINHVPNNAGSAWRLGQRTSVLPSGVCVQPRQKLANLEVFVYAISGPVCPALLVEELVNHIYSLLVS